MGKAAMCIKMLQILNTGRTYKVSELADLLETNPRNVIEYKKELDEVVSDSFGTAGFFIETIPGRYGGYKLNGSILLPALKLLQSEKEALLEGFHYSMAKKDFPKKDALTTGFAKVMSNVQIEEKADKMLVVDKYQLQMNEKDIDERYVFIEKAIEVKKTVEMCYLSLKSGEKIHLVDPYKLFLYNNSWFFLGWDHEYGKVLRYKLNRLKTYKMLDKKFTVYKYFRAEDYFDEHGFKDNGDYHHVVMTATGTRAMLLKERVYGRNQTIEELEDGSIKVEMDMQDDGTMLSFALSCGNEAVFYEPQWLIEKLTEKAQEILALYNKDDKNSENKE